MTFVRGIPISAPSSSSPIQQDCDNDSIVSASSEEVDRCEAEEAQAKPYYVDPFGKDIVKLFQLEDSPIIGKIEASLFSSKCNKTVPKICHILWKLVKSPSVDPWSLWQNRVSRESSQLYN